MVRSFAPATISFALAAVGALGASVPDGTWPESQGNVSYTEPYVVAAGEVFDGGMKTYDRSDITCEGQTESGSSTAVFKVEAGGTLKNVIIGTNQMEGVHCDDHDCTIENVWWEDVCEDALSIKGGDADSVSTVTGGGARYADDKVIQHNGYGSVVIDGFYAQEFGKLYRSCGTCGDRQRFVNVSNIYAVDPDVSIVTVNENYDDEAVLKNIYISASDDSYVICGWSEGNEDGEPTSLGDGIKDPLCQYSESDIHINEALPSSSGSSSTTTTTTSTTGSTDTAADSTAASADTETTTSYVSSSYGSTAASASSTTAESSYDESSAADEASSTYYTSSTASSAGSSTDYASSTTAESSYYESSSAASASSSSTTSTTTTSSTASSDAADDTSSYSEETTASSAASASSYSTESSSTEDASATSAASTSTEETEDEADTTEAGSTEAGSTSDVDTTTSSTTDETTDETTTDTSTPSKCSVRRHRA